ncbi:MAG TPA: sugar ABC transporter permease [Candidatus Kapabacteria bacterium]|nr:sugar ABC transporter permease [Candidatus Kapabacteria bacterium]HOV92460.1 sugar ABC transporter permease [Candidatus Kapabacteria bacterium]
MSKKSKEINFLKIDKIFRLHSSYSKGNIKENLNTLLLILPWLIVLVIFWLYPLIYAGYLSLTEYNTLTDNSVFIGLKNYKSIFTDEYFWIATKNTLYFVVISVPITLILSLILAELLNQKVAKFRSFFQAAYFMPSVTSLVVISLIFTNLYAKDGYLNTLFSMIGLPTSERGFLLDPSTALNSIIAMDVWLSIGYYMMLFLSSMQTISQDLYDSAKVNGANFWQQLRYITLPGLRSTIFFVIMLDLIKAFQVFIEIFVMTKGGPMYSTTSIVYYIFDTAFNHTDMMGYASAVAYILFFFLLALSLLQIKLSEEK